MSVLEVLALIGWGLAISLFVIWRETEHYYRTREEELVQRWVIEIKRHREVKEVNLIDNGRIIKDYPNVRRSESLPVLRRRTQSRLARIFDYMGILDYMNGNDIRMSGVIEMVNSRCRELNMTGRDYIYGIGIEEIKNQYDFKVVPSVFMDKFGEYLV